MNKMENRDKKDNKDNKFNNEDSNNYDPKQSEFGYDSEYTHGSWDPNAMSKPRAKYESREPLDSKNIDNNTGNNDSNDPKDPEDSKDINDLNNNAYNAGLNNGGRRSPNNPNNLQDVYIRMNQEIAKTRQPKNTVFVALITALITAVVTGVLVWSLSKGGILPGSNLSGNNSANANVHTIEGLGLSIHTDDPETEQEADKLAQIVKLLQDNYFSTLSPKEIISFMNKGILDAVDNPYTYYLTQENLADFHESMKGNYYGIGASVRKTDDGEYLITEIMENSPAEKAGLQRGDVIISVAGKSVSEFKDASDLAKNVRGEAGSSVEITVIRNAKEEKIRVIRGEVVQKVVRTRMLEDGIGYLYISDFTISLPEQFAAGVNKLLEAGAKDIVFDMRYNPGGSADSLIKVVDMLLDEARIAEIRGRDRGEAMREIWDSKDGKMVPDDMRYAILVNGNTASAAELFSGALRDHDKAVLIGSKTFGKGSGTRMFELIDHSGANITIFNYYLPKGDLIEGKGITPEIESEGPSMEVLQKKSIYELDPNEDPGLNKAIEYLKGLEK